MGTQTSKIGMYRKNRIREIDFVKFCSFAVIVRNDKRVIGSLTGGVLGSCIYTFTQIEYFWGANYLCPAAGCIDGER